MMGGNASPVTVAIVSTFNPQTNLVTNCESLLQQCADVVVVDDGSSSPDEGIFAAVSTLGCAVLRLKSNGGIAAALNRGFDVAKSRNAKLDFVLTMDQDSFAGPGFVRALEEAAAAAEAADLQVGMVAPGKVSGLPSRARKTVKGIVIGDEPVQSGLLIPAACMDAVGGFNEELFIDGVDSEFYLRAKARKLLCIIAPRAALTHSLGTMISASLGRRQLHWRGRPLLVRTAASWRYYFIMRNRILLARKFGAHEPYWAARGLFLDLRHLLLVSLLAAGRLERLSFALQGLRDGLRGQGGPRPKH